MRRRGQFFASTVGHGQSPGSRVEVAAGQAELLFTLCQSSKKKANLNASYVTAKRQRSILFTSIGSRPAASRISNKRGGHSLGEFGARLARRKKMLKLFSTKKGGDDELLRRSNGLVRHRRKASITTATVLRRGSSLGDEIPMEGTRLDEQVAAMLVVQGMTGEAAAKVMELAASHKYMLLKGFLLQGGKLESPKKSAAPIEDVPHSS